MYKLLKGFNNELAPCVARLEDGATIPFAPDNTDYQVYLKWVAEGNSPYPADSATPESAE